MKYLLLGLFARRILTMFSNTPDRYISSPDDIRIMSESKGAKVHINPVFRSSVDIINSVRFGEPVPPLQLL